MREILFRAKRIDYDKFPKEEWWIEGNAFVHDDGRTVDISTGTEKFSINKRVIPETLCQYTGLKDKNGNKIWENDIVKHEISDTIGTVRWYQGDYIGWCVDDVVIYEQQFTDEMRDECEVIGNIFDNPELLKGDTE